MGDIYDLTYSMPAGKFFDFLGWHATPMIFAFCAILPLSFMMVTGNVKPYHVQHHISFQALAMSLAILGTAFGIWLAVHMDNYAAGRIHGGIGVAAVVALLLQIIWSVFKYRTWRKDKAEADDFWPKNEWFLWLAIVLGTMSGFLGIWAMNGPMAFYLAFFVFTFFFSAVSTVGITFKVARALRARKAAKEKEEIDHSSADPQVSTVVEGEAHHDLADPRRSTAVEEVHDESADPQGSTVVEEVRQA